MRLYANQGTEYPTGRLYGDQVSADERREDRNRQLQAEINQVQDFSEPRMSRIPETIRPTPVKDWVSERKADIAYGLSGEATKDDPAKIIKGLPKAGVNLVDKVTEIVIPGMNAYATTAASVLWEGMAFAVNKDIRQRFLAGEPDVLPTIENTTPEKMLLYTVAAGIEAAIFAKIPPLAKLGWKARAGYGAIDGMGFAISEGIANDKSPEDILKMMPLYGVGGSAIAIMTPYLIPLLKSELRALPSEVRSVFKQLYEEAVPPVRKLTPTSVMPEPTRVPVSTPNTRYQEYLRRMGYEPYTPDEALPTIEFGEGAAARATDNVIDADTPLPSRSSSIPDRTSELTPRQQDVFVSESNRLIDEGFGPREAQNRALAIATNDISGAEMVPEPRQTAQNVSNSVQGEAITSAPVRQTEEIIDAGEAQTVATNREVPGQVQIEQVEVPMPEEVQRKLLPVGDGKRQYSRFAAEVAEDGERIRNTSPEAAERLGIATYQQANMASQYRAAAALVETDLDLALRIARQEATVPGLLDNAVVLALSRFARNTNNPKLAIQAGAALRDASLRATRLGQEIRVLRRDTGVLDDPVDVIAEIMNQRMIRAGGGSTKLTNKQRLANFEAKKQQLTDGAKKVIDNAQLKMAEAQKAIDDIIC